jgi:hypothetical protein
MFCLKILFIACLSQIVITFIVFTWYTFSGKASQVWPSGNIVSLPSPRYRPQASTNTITAHLFVAILTHSSRRERRDAIRDTWLSLCKQRPQVQCRFFSDEVGINTEAKNVLRGERDRNKDLEILNATGKKHSHSILFLNSIPFF